MVISWVAGLLIDRQHRHTGAQERSSIVFSLFSAQNRPDGTANAIGQICFFEKVMEKLKGCQIKKRIFFSPFPFLFPFRLNENTVCTNFCYLFFRPFLQLLHRDTFISSEKRVSTHTVDES